ncbi:hypothetical protein SmJEL517_g01374 [Synchytrium microbalum]|uniref:J domain-containing protein n=1 Tax=Synchytrium microbalum TaxID=1806994 RepID=A0A507CGB9_9FUNG|nr:uncharacterized protein SmJEL517_g01374 [Synchytrium microbalum]TPX36533.1 hypothetical protein SmJEL517_g01374 [Synchytrium microbalum]
MASASSNTDDTFDVETFLRTEATKFHQDLEIDRILNCVKHNAVEVLELPPQVWISGIIDPKQVKLQYRKKSLLTHPDKSANPKASEAFEILKKSESTLTNDKEQTSGLLEMIKDARNSVFKQLKIASASEARATASETIVAIRMEVRRMIRDVESREIVKNRNEVERKKQEEDRLAETKKRKAELDKAWEETREDRVGSWRDFKKAGPKKKTKKEDDVVPKMFKK